MRKAKIPRLTTKSPYSGHECPQYCMEVDKASEKLFYTRLYTDVKEALHAYKTLVHEFGEENVSFQQISYNQAMRAISPKELKTSLNFNPRRKT